MTTRTRRHVARLGIGAVVAGMAIASFAGPAQADLEALCDDGEVCLFKDTGYNGGIRAWVGNDTDYSDNNFNNCSVICDVNDEASSVDNDGLSCDTGHYLHSGFRSGVFVLARGAAKASLSSTANDNLSSHNWLC